MKYVIAKEKTPNGSECYCAYDEKGVYVVGALGNSVEECELRLINIVRPDKEVVKEVEI